MSVDCVLLFTNTKLDHGTLVLTDPPPKMNGCLIIWQIRDVTLIIYSIWFIL